jgi:recombination protein RecT
MTAVAKAADQQLQTVKTPKSLQGLNSDQIVQVLSNHDLKFSQILGSESKAARFKQIVVTNALTNPKVLEDTKSFIGSCLQGAATGMEQGMGRWAIVPFKGRAQFMLMYQGMIEMARNTGTIKSIWAEVVREGDEFEEEHGFHPDIRHKVARPRSGQLMMAYACVHFTNGGGDFEIMDKDEVMAIKARSAGVRSGKSTPWGDVDFEPEMWKKTVLKRLGKRLPLTSDTRRHFAVDEAIITDDDFDLSAGGVNPDTVERPDYSVEDDDEKEMPDTEGQAESAAVETEITGESVVDSPVGTVSDAALGVPPVQDKMTPEDILLAQIRKIEESYPDIKEAMRDDKTDIGKFIYKIKHANKQVRELAVLHEYELQTILAELKKLTKGK